MHSNSLYGFLRELGGLVGMMAFIIPRGEEFFQW